MTPRLWIAYDYTSIPECLKTLETIVARHPDPQIIHEIGRPTIINAALAGTPIVKEFRQRLTEGQTLVADYKGYDVPYSAEARFYYEAGVDLVTVMATAPDEAVREAIDGARGQGKLVAFDLMSHQDDEAKVRRAEELARLGAELISCHTGWSEQAAGKRPHALLAKVHRTLGAKDVKLVAMGGLTPESVADLREYAEADRLFAVVAGSAITRSDDPAGAVSAFLEAIAGLGARRTRAPSHMKAAVVRALGAPLNLETIDVPEPGPEQVLVRIEASGLCHTDIHAARGEWPVKPALPLIPGHEGVGTVERVGARARGMLAEGDRVAVPFLGYACGICGYCVDGRETLCPDAGYTGFVLPGGYAEYVAANARHVVKVPDGVDPMEAAPLTCAGVTTYKAVRVGGARAGTLTAVWGVGGLGHLAIQYAKIAGSEVVAVARTERSLEVAREVGCDHTVNARHDPAQEIHKLGGADTVILLAPAADAFEHAYASLARGGTLVLVGLPPDNHVTLPIFETVINGATVTGSIVGTRHDLEEVFLLHQQRRTRVLYEERQLEHVNEAFEDVLRGATRAPRVVFRL